MRRKTIFISSAVERFEDLRSALQFELEQRGLAVILSESPDFPTEWATSAMNECLNNARTCDYYLLLIGDAPGSPLPDDSSPTREEYLAALESRRKTGTPQLILTVRGTTAVGKTGFARTFLDEVQRGQEDDDPTYVKRWTTFGDLVSIVETRLNLGRNFEETRLRAALLYETLSNLRRLITRNRNTVVTKHQWIRPAVIELQLDRAGLDGQICVSPKVAIALAGLMSWWTLAQVDISASRQALHSGDFTTYDAELETFHPTPLHTALEALVDDVDLARRSNDLQPAVERLMAAAALANRTKADVTVDAWDALQAIHYHDRAENVFQRLLSVGRFLLGVGRAEPAPDPSILRPRSPIPEMEAEFYREDVSIGDVRTLLERDVSPLGERPPRGMFTGADVEKWNLDTDAIVHRLRRAHPDVPEPSPLEIGGVVKKALRRLIAEAPEGIEDRSCSAL